MPPIKNETCSVVWRTCAECWVVCYNASLERLTLELCWLPREGQSVQAHQFAHACADLARPNIGSYQGYIDPVFFSLNNHHQGCHVTVLWGPMLGYYHTWQDQLHQLHQEHMDGNIQKLFWLAFQYESGQWKLMPLVPRYAAVAVLPAAGDPATGGGYSHYCELGFTCRKFTASCCCRLC